MGTRARASEALKICKNKSYMYKGVEKSFGEIEFTKAIFIPHEKSLEYQGLDIDAYKHGKPGEIVFLNDDSYDAARKYDNVLVHNFADAYTPGGAFLLGGTAQEETLCKHSSLYASLKSSEASKMYRYNHANVLKLPAESDAMLLSPNVVIFKDGQGETLEDYSVCAVISSAAPNMHGASRLLRQEKVDERFLRRIRTMLHVAMENGYKNIILGAWGCGAFGNKPQRVAGYFKKVLIDEEFAYCFDHVVFSIYGRENGKNYVEFKKVFHM